MMDIGADTLLNLISDLGALGFILWLVHRTTTHTVPRLARSFEDAVERQRQTFIEELRIVRGEFKDEIKTEREFFGSQIERLTGAVESLEETVREKGEE